MSEDPRGGAGDGVTGGGAPGSPRRSTVHARGDLTPGTCPRFPNVPLPPFHHGGSTPGNPNTHPQARTALRPLLPFAGDQEDELHLGVSSGAWRLPASTSLPAPAPAGPSFLVAQSRSPRGPSFFPPRPRPFPSAARCFPGGLLLASASSRAHSAPGVQPTAGSELPAAGGVQAAPCQSRAQGPPSAGPTCVR